MSAQLGFDIPVDVGAPNTLDPLRQAVTAAQAAAVAELRKCDDASGEENGADTLAADFLRADDVQRELLRWLYEWQARDEADYDDEDNWGHPEGPLTENERAMMKTFQRANDRINDLRMAIYALRAGELAEFQRAGVAPRLEATR